MAQHTSAPICLDFSATPQALAAIAAMGRTEDIRFSPDRRRLAVAAMARQRIFVFAIEVLAGKRIHLSDAVELSSPHLQAPHGLDFLDDDSLAVANRDGELCLFRMPPCGSQAQGELALLRSFPNDICELLGPGSVAASQCADGQHELLVCRNVGQRLSRHMVAAAQGYTPSAENLLPGDWLATPNGISLGASRRWRAVSNLHDQCALLYAHESTDDQPQAVLCGASHPHGIRIADDDRYLLLADAGGPYVHIYHQPDGLWRGIYDPAMSLRVMDEPLFQSRHAFPPSKGGPKGLDLDTAAGLLVTTSQTQPLAFFDLDQALARVQHQGPRSFAGSVLTQDVRHQLERQRRHARVEREALRHERLASDAEHRAAEAVAHAARVEARLAEMSTRAGHFQARSQALLASSSWRITAPLRRLFGRRNTPRP